MCIDHIPQFLMIGVKHDDRTSRLDMEGARGVEDGVVHDLDDAGVGDGAVFLEVDGRTTHHRGFEEGEFGCHVGGVGFGGILLGCGVCHCEGGVEVLFW